MSNIIKRTGRPSKLTEDFINAAKQVLFTDKSTIIFTDAELLDAINELLETKVQVAQRTFEDWKAKALAGNPDSISAQGIEFLRLYKKALREQKQALFIALAADEKAWQKWAWVIERKFTEWNLRHIASVDHTTKGESLNKLSDTELNAEIEAEIQKLLANN